MPANRVGSSRKQQIKMAYAKTNNLAGDFWGGTAAMLVALPAAIAFGVTIYAALGGTYAAYGALAGILGATALGLVASLLGGTNRLITAPCAPAAAVLSAFAIEQIQRGTPAEAILLLLTVLGLSAGLLQLLFGDPQLAGHLMRCGLAVGRVGQSLGRPQALHQQGHQEHRACHHCHSDGAGRRQGLICT